MNKIIDHLVESETCNVVWYVLMSLLFTLGYLIGGF